MNSKCCFLVVDSVFLLRHETCNLRIMDFGNTTVSDNIIRTRKHAVLLELHSLTTVWSIPFVMSTLYDGDILISQNG